MCSNIYDIANTPKYLFPFFKIHLGHEHISAMYAKDYQLTKKVKIFSVTTVTGGVWAKEVPIPWSTETIAQCITRSLGPWLQKQFPAGQPINILLDNENILRGPAARAAWDNFGVTLMGGWPSSSPDLNPCENVWPWSEKALRDLEKPNDTEQTFRNRVAWK